MAGESLAEGGKIVPFGLTKRPKAAQPDLAPLVQNQKPVNENQTEIVEGSTEFAELVRRNLENRERMRRERQKANAAVLKSYRIKQQQP